MALPAYAVKRTTDNTRFEVGSALKLINLQYRLFTDVCRRLRPASVHRKTFPWYDGLSCLKKTVVNFIEGLSYCQRNREKHGR